MLDIPENYTRAVPLTGLELVQQELQYRLDRMSLYGESFSQSQWLEWLGDLNNEAQNIEFECTEDHIDDYTHDDCYSVDQLDDLISDAVKEKTKQLQDTLDRLMNQKSRQSKQTLLNRIDQLEGELSDARADYHVLKGHVDRSVVAAQLAEDFIFTPEEARSQFKVIAGGGA